jgi:copper(I)-binding protein
VNRALRAATLAVLLLSPVALTACSAGQVNQTSTQNRDKTGPQFGHGDIALRAVLLEAPPSGRYDEGDDAELHAALINKGEETETLVSIQGDSFEGVRAIGGNSQAVNDASGFSTELNIEIPPRQTVYLGTGDAPSVLLENLTESLTAGQQIEFTMTFENAGELDVQAMVDNPQDEVARGEAFDFHQEEQEAGSDNREAAAGAGQGN